MYCRNVLVLFASRVFNTLLSRVYHISEINIDTLDIMKIVILIELLKVLMIKSRLYDKTLARS